MKYNDITVPPLIRTDRIISAFSNCINDKKVQEYADIMQQDMLSHDFPPIKGYPAIIDDNDTGKTFMNGEEITEENIGQLCWNVTDGHHRTLAAITAHLPHLEVKLDYSCITSEEDLREYNATA